jgi:hypothetical protein
VKRLMLLVTAIVVIAGGCSEQAEHTTEVPAHLRPYVEYVKQQGQSPTEYIASKFADHDVVWLGEHHRIKHDPLLVQQLVPVVYERGVRGLATEFARKEDQPLIDSLLRLDEYDESIARDVTFRQFVHWRYQEYIDIFKAVWEFNQTLPDTAEPFWIYGMDCSPDWSLVKTPEDRDKYEVMQKVWGGCSEEDWAPVILAQVEQGKKLLAYSGIHHAFTRYLQPVVSSGPERGEFIRFEERRAGRYVYEALGDRVMTVFLHSPWNGPRGYNDSSYLPAGGIVDSVMAALGPDYYPVGFDVDIGPFGELRVPHSVYAIGYEDFTLGQFCDGYIFQRPFAEYEAVTSIPDFINAQNLEYARNHTMNPKYREFTVEKAYEDDVQMLEAKQRRWRSLAD